MNLKLTEHTILINRGNQFFILYNVLLRNGVLIDKKFFSKEISANTKEKYYFKDMSTFSLSKSLVDNPNGIINEIDYESLIKTSKNNIILKCEELSILAKDNSYLKRIGLKTSIFDREHVGNFHQQIGQFLLNNKKTNPEEWWIYQKFNKDLNKTKDNPYFWVQEVFIKSYFNKKLLKNKNILDFGGGVGYYSDYFASYSNTVDLVEPSKLYINIGKKVFGNRKNLNFILKDFKKKEDFRFLEKKYDFIFLIDVFLYFFVPYQKIDITPSILLKKLKGKLNKNGKIFIIDPHGAFHLQAYFKNERPFMISTEYNNKKYRVTPTLEEMSLAIENSGLTISKIRELKYEGNDDNKMFYKEFPFWWFFELTN